MILPMGVVRSGNTMCSTGVPFAFRASTSMLHCEDLPASNSGREDRSAVRGWTAQGRDTIVMREQRIMKRCAASVLCCHFTVLRCAVLHCGVVC